MERGTEEIDQQSINNNLDISYDLENPTTIEGYAESQDNEISQEQVNALQESLEGVLLEGTAESADNPIEQDREIDVAIQCELDTSDSNRREGNDDVGGNRVGRVANMSHATQTEAPQVQPEGNRNGTADTFNSSSPFRNGLYQRIEYTIFLLEEVRSGPNNYIAPPSFTFDRPDEIRYVVQFSRPIRIGRIATFPSGVVAAASPPTNSGLDTSGGNLSHSQSESRNGDLSTTLGDEISGQSNAGEAPLTGEQAPERFGQSNVEEAPVTGEQAPETSGQSSAGEVPLTGEHAPERIQPQVEETPLVAGDTATALPTQEINTGAATLPQEGTSNLNGPSSSTTQGQGVAGVAQNQPNAIIFTDIYLYTIYVFI